MRHNIYDRLSVLPESTQDSIYDEYLNIYTEKLETNILDKTLAKTMTLYHGSNKDLETIRPVSVNMGTRLSKTRLSSFWTRDKESCIIWAAMFIFHHIGFPYKVSIRNKTIYTPDVAYMDKREYERLKQEIYRHASTWLKMYYKTEPLYVYTLEDAPVRKIGRGQINADEYTLDEEVVPTKKEKLSWDTLSKYITYIHRERFDTLPEELFGRSGKDASFIEKLIFRDGEKTMKNRVDIYGKAYNQYKHGIGEHELLTYKYGDWEGSQIIPNLKNIKK